MSIIPATQKADIEWQSKEGPGKNVRPYLKNKLKQNRLGL
jgi:hypothetical protein